MTVSKSRTGLPTPCRSGTGSGILGMTRGYMSREIAWMDPKYNRNVKAPLLTWDRVSDLFAKYDLTQLSANANLAGAYEAIVGHGQKKPYNRTLDVEHVRAERSVRPYDVIVNNNTSVQDGSRFYTNPTAPLYSTTYDLLSGYAVSVPALPSYPATPPLADFEKFALRAVAAMWPNMRAEYDSFIFMSQLKDLSRLKSAIGSLAVSMAKAYNSAFKIAPDTTLGEIARADLAYEFGFLQLVRDVAGVASLTQRAERQFVKWKRAGKCGETRHYTWQEEEVTSSAQAGYLVTETTTVRLWHATWRMRYYPFPNVSFDSWDNAGLGGSARGVWDLVPFSFVVDRILATDAFLNRLDREHRLQICTDDFSVSCKAYTQTTVSVRTGTIPGTAKFVELARVTKRNYPKVPWDDGAHAVDDDLLPIAYSKAHRYSRKRMVPDLQGVPWPTLEPRSPGGLWAYSLGALGLLRARKSYRNTKRLLFNKKRKFVSRWR